MQGIKNSIADFIDTVETSSVSSPTGKMYHRKSFVFYIAFHCSQPGTVIMQGWAAHTERGFGEVLHRV